MPPKEVVVRASALANSKLKDIRTRRRDRQWPTYATGEVWFEGPLVRLFQSPSIEAIASCEPWLGKACLHYLDHQFDLLGSGWVDVYHGVQCKGLDGHSYHAAKRVRVDRDGRWLVGRINPGNLSESRRVWRLIDTGYTPIDWQLDFKSGYRWSQQVWSRNITYGQKIGADVKVPWELSRMQHLSRLAWWFAATKQGAGLDREPDVIVRAFRNQVLDFVATNPPRFGVNWSCTMDVAIRVANWLVAYDLFRSAGAVFDRPFEAFFKRSVYEHGRHIVINLEWSDSLRANHYLADMVGLLFVAVYLPSCQRTDAWLRFATRELIQEVELQFGIDGASFEGSTSYHRLSAQMVVYATALILALDDRRLAALQNKGEDDPMFRSGKPAPPLQFDTIDGMGRKIPFPAWYLQRVAGMGRFAAAMTRPDGKVCQFGDNDSGYFLKFCEGWDGGDIEEQEQHLDHRHLMALVNALVEGDRFDQSLSGAEALNQMIRKSIGGKPIPVSKENSQLESVNGHWQRFDDFGVYVYRNEGVYLAVRCGSVGQNGFGGHAHNDQLSFELCLGQKPVVVDPGTCVYTPLPDLRNRMRSTAMHSTLAVDGLEQNSFDTGRVGLFSMNHQSHGRVVELAGSRMVALHEGYGAVHRRSFTVVQDGIEVVDHCELDKPKEIRIHLDPSVEILETTPTEVILLAGDNQIVLSAQVGRWQVTENVISPGYGKWVKSHVCLLPHESVSVRWWLKLKGG